MAETEKELTIYAKIGNFEGLNEASSKEHHVQVEGRFSKGHKCRTRETTKEDGSVDYVFLFKLEGEDVGIIASKIEHPIVVTKEFFDAFKQVAEKLVKKTRYIFYSKNNTIKKPVNGEISEIELPDIKYEVDVYETTDGKKVDWCKIDIELDKLMEHLDENHKDVNQIKFNVSVAHLPFKPTEPIVSTTDDDEQKARLNQIWEVFNQKPI